MIHAREVSAALLGCWALQAVGCATYPVSAKEQVSQEQAVMSGRGAPARLKFPHWSIRGELIAVKGDVVWILTDPGTLEGYRLSTLESVALGVHDNNATAFGMWTGVGALSTVSHGAVLIFTLPLWLVAGISISVAESHRGIIEYPPAPFAALNVYARFPQGLPAGVTPEQLLKGPAMPDPDLAPQKPSLRPAAPPQ